jgi:predicted aminopeptidase
LSILRWIARDHREFAVAVEDAGVRHWARSTSVKTQTSESTRSGEDVLR